MTNEDTTFPLVDAGAAALASGRVSRHELNTVFAWERHEGPFRRVTAEQAASYDDNGYFVLKDAFAADELARVIAEIDPFEDEVEGFLQQMEDGKFFIARAGEITFTTHLVAKSARLREFVSGPVFQDLVADLIGPDVRLYWDQAVYKKPGTDSPFPWHQDNGYTFIEPQQYLTCWVALTDADEANGCPWVIPGLHHLGTLAHTEGDLGHVCLTDAQGAVPAPAKAGSIVVFSSLTPHSTGPNHTGGTRKSYIVQFAPDGASMISGSAADDKAARAANEPDRQFPVLVNGAPPVE